MCYNVLTLEIWDVVPNLLGRHAALKLILVQSGPDIAPYQYGDSKSNAII